MQKLSIILIILKYCGAVGASIYGVYATMTEFKEDRQIGNRTVKLLSKKGYIGIAFLGLVSLVNLGATGLQDYKDKKDNEAHSAEVRERFDRIYHPLGTVTIQPTFGLLLDGDRSFKTYATQLSDWVGSMPNDYPPGQTQPAAPLPPMKSMARNAMLAYMNLNFVFTKKKTAAKAGSQGDESFADSHGDLSFFVSERPVKKSSCTPEYTMTGFTLSGRCFSVDSNDTDTVLLFSDSRIRSAPDDRYSDGEIISTTDLLGATLLIEVCPYLASDLHRNYSLKKIDMTFPGEQTMTLKDLVGVSKDNCTVYSYTFPSKPENLQKLLTFQGVE